MDSYKCGEVYTKLIDMDIGRASLRDFEMVDAFLIETATPSRTACAGKLHVACSGRYDQSDVRSRTTRDQSNYIGCPTQPLPSWN